MNFWFLMSMILSSALGIAALQIAALLATNRALAKLLRDANTQTDIRYCPHCEEDTQQEVQEYDDVSRDYQRCLTCDATYREIGGWTHADSGASQ